MTWIENLLRDVRLGIGSLARSPGFTAVAVLSLAVGIGAATAVFSLVHAVLLRSLPVPNPQELRILQWSGTDFACARSTAARGRMGTAGLPPRRCRTRRSWP